MRISFNQTTSPNVRDVNGYGYAAKMCKESLEVLGHSISWRDETADIEINFIQPENWYWSGPYRIAYLPWESTKLHDGWVEKLNNEVDEVWTPSPIVAQWMADDGVKKSIKVYQHGVDDIWHENMPHRDPTGTFEVIHHGAEALRKGGQYAINSFMEVLWEEDACLTMKMKLQQFNLHDSKHIKIRKDRVPIEDLVQLYFDSDLMVYPTWGEGFGLVPIQAMAGGMPVLVTRGTLPYEYLLNEENLIESTLVDSPWPGIHPGQMLRPEFDDLKDKLRYHFDNRSEQLSLALPRASEVMADYNWLELTRRAFEDFS